MKDFLKNIVVKILISEAKFVLKRNNPKIIAITGNLGKTSTKDFIYNVLQDNLKSKTGETQVLASPKSMNSEFGVPLTILQMKTGWDNPLIWIKIIFQGLVRILDRYSYKYLVLEIGADAPGDIRNITRYIKPDIVVMTAFARVPVHVEFFNNQRENIIREKKYLVEALKKGGTFIYNLDDEDCRGIAEDVKDMNIQFSTFALKDKSADVYISDIEIGYKEIHKFADTIVGSLAKIHIGEGSEDIHLAGVVGEGIYYSLMPAILIAKKFEITLERAIKDIETVERTKGRMRVLSGIHNSTIIDDTYNASPKAVENGIEFMLDAKTKGQKIFVLGDMLELGEYTKSEHERIGKLVASVADILITSGVRSEAVAKQAIEHGLDKSKVFITKNSIEARDKLQDILEQEIENDYQEGRGEQELGGDLIFIKGSQGSRMERVSRGVIDTKYNPTEVLVRQEEIWERK